MLHRSPCRASPPRGSSVESAAIEVARSSSFSIVASTCGIPFYFLQSAHQIVFYLVRPTDHDPWSWADAFLHILLLHPIFQLGIEHEFGCRPDGMMQTGIIVRDHSVSFSCISASGLASVAPCPTAAHAPHSSPASWDGLEKNRIPASQPRGGRSLTRKDADCLLSTKGNYSHT